MQENTIFSPESISERFIRACVWLRSEKRISTNGELATFLGLDPSLLSNLKNKRANIGLEKLALACSKFPETLNLDWLLFGTGEMLKAAPANRPDSAGPQSISDKLIACMEEKEKLLKEIFELKSPPGGYNFTVQHSPELNERP